MLSSPEQEFPYFKYMLRIKLLFSISVIVIILLTIVALIFSINSPVKLNIWSIDLKFFLPLLLAIVLLLAISAYLKFIFEKRITQEGELDEKLVSYLKFFSINTAILFVAAALPIIYSILKSENLYLSFGTLGVLAIFYNFPSRANIFKLLQLDTEDQSKLNAELQNDRFFF